jgi:hypothetical protein
VDLDQCVPLEQQTSADLAPHLLGDRLRLKARGADAVNGVARRSESGEVGSGLCTVAGCDGRAEVEPEQ